MIPPDKNFPASLAIAEHAAATALAPHDANAARHAGLQILARVARAEEQNLKSCCASNAGGREEGSQPERRELKTAE